MDPSALRLWVNNRAARVLLGLIKQPASEKESTELNSVVPSLTIDLVLHITRDWGFENIHTARERVTIAIIAGISVS